jgi:DNA replicative helicase MCM subunit Mcm2 (Cdc46/Mcm family)
MNRTGATVNESSSFNFNLTAALEEPDESDLSLPTIKNTKSIPMIKVRVLNYRPLTKIKLLKANMYDKLVTILGTVTRVSTPRPFITRLAFECTKCNTTFQVGNKKYSFQAYILFLDGINITFCMCTILFVRAHSFD